MSLDAALERYLVQLQADGRAPATQSQYARHIRLLMVWLQTRGAVPDMEDLTEADVASFLASETVTKTCSGTPRKVTSANAIRSSLKCFLSFCANAGLTPRNSGHLIRRARGGSSPPRPIRDGELARLRQVLREATEAEDVRDRMLLELLVGTGLRLSSALQIEVGDVDLDEGILDVRRTKNGHHQVVHLPADLREQLREFIGDRTTGSLFRGRHGRAPTSRHWGRRFRVWRERASVSDKVTPHSARHRYAMETYRETKDVLEVRRALGHRSLSSTLVYVAAAMA